MTITSGGDVERQLLDPAVDFESIYENHLPLLIGVAIERFQIPHAEAEALAHEVFLSYFLRSHRVRDARTWLLGAMFNTCKAYRRQRARERPLPDELADASDPSVERLSDSLADAITAQQAFSCLSARCQLALRLRYIDGYTVPEVAVQLRTSAKYAQNLVCRCLRQARERLMEPHS